jgi:hypothetical protein
MKTNIMMLVLDMQAFVESEEVKHLSMCRVAHVANDCPQNASEETTFSTLHITGCPETYSMS